MKTLLSTLLLSAALLSAPPVHSAFSNIPATSPNPTMASCNGWVVAMIICLSIKPEQVSWMYEKSGVRNEKSYA